MRVWGLDLRVHSWSSVREEGLQGSQAVRGLVSCSQVLNGMLARSFVGLCNIGVGIFIT